jgi:hypothetical protein
MRSRHERLRVFSLAAAIGAFVPLVFAATVHVEGARTLEWPAFRSLLMFVYPFATVPVRSSLYLLFVLSVALNVCYYILLALVTTVVRCRAVSTVVMVLVVLLLAAVAGPALHLAFEALGLMSMQ